MKKKRLGNSTSSMLTSLTVRNASAHSSYTARKRHSLEHALGVLELRGRFETPNLHIHSGVISGHDTLRIVVANNKTSILSAMLLSVEG